MFNREPTLVLAPDTFTKPSTRASKISSCSAVRVNSAPSRILKVSPAQFLMTITASNPSVRQAKKVNQNFAKVYADLLEKEKKKITKKILRYEGCILLIDYGYLKPNNQNTLQSVMNHKKNNLLENLGNADITAHVNFGLLNEFFLKNGLKLKKIVTQQQFLTNMGIIKRAKILARNMKFSEQSDLYLRIKRLISPVSMGSLFKVILAYKFDKNDFSGFN